MHSDEFAALWDNGVQAQAQEDSDDGDDETPHSLTSAALASQRFPSRSELWKAMCSLQLGQQALVVANIMRVTRGEGTVLDIKSARVPGKAASASWDCRCQGFT